MGKKPTSYRTTISISQDLRHRMEKVQEQVNWSALAARAFEEKLAEIASKKVRKTMDDVIQRLRVSKEQADDASFKEGEKIGRRWAENRATAEQLMRLERFREKQGYDWDSLFQENDGTSFWNPEEILAFRILFDSEEPDSQSAKEFWERALDERAGKVENPLFVKGFAEGALDLWREVKDKL